MIAKHSAAIFQKRELKNNFRHEFAIIQERLSRIYDLDEWSFGVERIDEMEQNHSREGYTPSDYEHLGIPKDTSRCYLVYLYESAPFADNIMGY